jgi:uncharacterized glyoxalase superfamily protein PhnB
VVSKISISLPIESRRTAHDFYRNALDLMTVGAPSEDGMPEPLQFALDARTSLLLIPSDGMEWVIGKGRLVSDGRNECLLSLEVANEMDVQRVFQRCVDAGASVVSEPSQKEWGYEGIFADPDGHLWMVAVSDRT